ncbi:MAG: Na/Pi cotransporter family protein [Methylobacteriaceae bacterium]|nr:Na/Pi cotransporter family protein [Methylobacteriaceae bacterium]
MNTVDLHATQLLAQLVGAVALLLWGVRMVRTGATRAFGSELRRVMASCARSRTASFLSGLAVTGLVQSSMATALVVSSFTARGLIGLPAALAMMFGADVGSTLVAQAFAFDVKWLWSLAVLAGVALFNGSTTDRARGMARMALGVGFVLLALTHLGDVARPLAQSAAFRTVMSAIAGEPIIAVLVAAAITWFVHSSLTIVLFVMSLAGAGAVTTVEALALIAGANVGGALAPLIAQSGQAPAARRVPLGNLIVRAAAAAIALPFLAAIAPWMSVFGGGAARAAINFHTVFNLAAALVALPLTGPLARLCEKLLPDPRETAEPTGPRYLDDALIEQPDEALASAMRETLRVGDKVEAMLRNAFTVLERDDQKLMKQVGDADNEVDKLYEAIKHYLMKISRNELPASEAQRYVEILTFTTNLEHVGDIIDKNLMELAAKKIKHRYAFSSEGLDEIRDFHGRVISNLRLAMNVFATGDVNLARRLLSEKTSLREVERRAAESHFMRLRAGRAESIETSSIHLDVIRDLKRINGHLTSVAYQILETAGELTESRLKSEAGGDVARAGES